MVAGMRLSAGILEERSEPSLCGVVVVVAVAAVVKRRRPLLGLAAMMLELNDNVLKLKRREWDWDWNVLLFGESKRGRTVARTWESRVRWAAPARELRLRKVLARSAVIDIDEAMIWWINDDCFLSFWGFRICAQKESEGFICLSQIL